MNNIGIPWIFIRGNSHFGETTIISPKLPIYELNKSPKYTARITNIGKNIKRTRKIFGPPPIILNFVGEIITDFSCAASSLKHMNECRVCCFSRSYIIAHIAPLGNACCVQHSRISVSIKKFPSALLPWMPPWFTGEALKQPAPFCVVGSWELL